MKNNIYRIVAKIPNIQGLHVAFYGAKNEYQAIFQMLNQFEMMSRYDIKSISLFKKEHNKLIEG